MAINQSIDETIDRLNFCFKYVVNKRYFNGKDTYYNHLYSDHHLVFIWLLANTIWKNTSNKTTASKLYYLNKALHGFDCMYDTDLPNVFLIFHGVGTMLGKAKYGDFFVALHGCTVGSHGGYYPTLGVGTSLTANTSVIGNCNIGNRVNIGTRAFVFNKDVASDSTLFIDKETNSVKIKESTACYAQQFFNVDLSSLT